MNMNKYQDFETLSKPENLLTLLKLQNARYFFEVMQAKKPVTQ